MSKGTKRKLTKDDKAIEELANMEAGYRSQGLNAVGESLASLRKKFIHARNEEAQKIGRKKR